MPLPPPRSAPPTWGNDLRSYEREKRHTVDEGLLQGPPVRITGGIVKACERVYDPLLQRHRDAGRELQQRNLEERERVAHLNRAQDIQILREQPFNIIRHDSRLEGIAPGFDPRRTGREARPEGRSMPDTYVDYNVVSNVPFHDHHWARPDDRPRGVARSPAKTRLVPANTVKDFDVVTNRYTHDHAARNAQANRLNLLDATQKYNTHRPFDPVTQQFNDPRVEERSRTCDDARDVEVQLRAHAQIPPSYKGRESAHYDVITHEVGDGGMLRTLDGAEDARKDRYQNRYIVENNFHVRDIRSDHVLNSRSMNRIAPERFEDTTRRGFNVVTNRPYGHSRGGPSQTLYASFGASVHDPGSPSTRQRLTPWQRTQTSASERADESGRHRGSRRRPSSAGAAMRR